ncbi:MAG: hypothetical protein HRF47_09500 [Chloroflexota bacterium]|jgi:hypothetical protein
MNPSTFANTSSLTPRANAARWKQGWAWALVLTVALALALALNHLPFTAVDWLLYEKTLAHPLDPYRFDFFNPPWTVWFLLPLGWASSYSVGAVRVVMLAVFVRLAYSRGVRGVNLALLASSAPLLFLVANGNIDFLPALGFLLADKGSGLALLLVKPQTGIFAALAWMRRAGGWRGVVRMLLPTLGLFALSLLLYGWWPARAIGNVLRMQGVGLPNVAWNTSVFPWGVPLGLYLAWRAWRNADEFHGVTASLLLSPYTPLYSLTLWYTLFLGRARRWQAVLAWLIFWLVYAWHYLGVGAWLLNRIS